ncbi:MAG: CPBP family intramembrane metalloprotease [Bacillota bacterium]|nr:CPBP family intramembrane metalloprotease [Bacillota bacterium]
MLRRKVTAIVAWSSELPLLPFTVVMALGSLLARILLIPILLLTGTEPSASVGAMEVSPWLALVVGPAVETLLFQALPIRLASALRAPIWLQLVVSTTLFGLAHLSGGVASVAVAVSGGLAFAWAFIKWSQASITKGLLATVLTHCWVNAAVYLLIQVLQ